MSGLETEPNTNTNTKREDVRHAIDNGDIVELRRALDKGAGINIRFGKYQATPIHFASKKQSLEIVEELVNRGADVNGRDKIDDRPLHEATRFGEQSILSFLLEKNAKPDVQNNYGDTPLMYCFDTTRFRTNGWTKKAQVLLNHGATKALRNEHGQTALDHLHTFLQRVRNGKSIDNEIRSAEELAEAYHLYDVLKEVHGKGEEMLLAVIQSQNENPEPPLMCHGHNFKEMCESALLSMRNRDWTLNWERLDDVPSEIHELGTVTEDMFLRSMATKHVQPKYIRLMIVGDVGVGKTSLCLNLIGEDGDATPTDGINVFIQSYLVDMKTGKWRKLSNEDIHNLPTKLLSTVCRAEKTTGSRETGRRETGSRETGGRDVTETTSAEEQESDRASPPVKRKKIDTLKGVNSNGVVKDDDAFLSVWDFAGDEIYEATHHIFMSPDAVYIIVFNGSACLADQSNLEKLYTWQEVIRTYSTEPTNREPTHREASNRTPPIILVGTHFDQMGNSEYERKANQKKLFHKMTKVASHSQLFFVDNTNKLDPTIQRIRDAIVTLATCQRNWNKRIPATWVKLDRDLRLLKQQRRYTLRLTDVTDIDKSNEVSIGDPVEIRSCLRYMHLTGNILFFENEQESVGGQEPFIVTHPQWIVDAFRCIIKAMRFVETHEDDSTKLHITQFQMSGMLTIGLLRRLWVGEYCHHQDILIEIMQRLHLLVAVAETTEERTWIVPSMLRSRDATFFQEVLSHRFAVVSKTLCFVFKSKVLPAIYDKLLARCLSSNLKVRKNSKDESLMQRGSACLCLGRACDLLLSCGGAVVSVTLVNRNKDTNFKKKGLFVWNLLCDSLDDIFTRFHHSNIPYELCLHCTHGICNDNCPVPIGDIITEGRVLCCENSTAEDQHWLHRSDVEPWMDSEKRNEESDEDFQLPLEILNSQPTGKMLAILSSRFIGSQYNMFFGFLGLQSSTVSTYRTTSDTTLSPLIYKLFEAWMKKNGKDATVREILKAMKEMDLDYAAAAVYILQNNEESDEGNQLMKDSKLPSGEQKYLFQDESALHYEAHHGGIHFLHTFAQSNEEKIWPLHVASSLGLKQNVSYLLQAGWDLDEKDHHDETPVQKADNQTLAKYMERCKCPAETETVELQPQGDDTHGECTVLPIIMDTVDLSTRKVYWPSFQFRKTFQKEQHKRLLFTSRYFTTYETVCQHQLYGVLWLLGKYGKDMFTCLNDICLPDWSIQHYRDTRTGKLDVTPWLRNNEQRRQQQQQQQQQHTGTRTVLQPAWSQSILKENIEQFKVELQRGIEHLDDGWTPIHYAILTRQHDLVKLLVDTHNVNFETRASTLLPQFILDELKHWCTFEYDYVYKHTAGFTPLLLATFIGNTDAIDILGKHVTRQLYLGDCLTLAYCDETEDNLLDILCGLGEKYIDEKYNVNMKLHSVYEKDCPNRRILIGSSDDIHRRIEEDFFPVRLILDNENIIREILKPDTTLNSAKDTAILGQILQSHADQLWRRHSNLNAIMPGRTSSLSEDRCNDESMVVLHCSHKGFIHTGELPFQKYLRNGRERVRAHVVQGFFRLGPQRGISHQTIDSKGEKGKVQVGYKVKYVDADMMATLGIMVEDLDGNTGILTCAHTFLKDFMETETGPSYNKLYDKNGPLQVEVLLRQPELLVSAHHDMEVDADVSQISMMSGHQTTGLEGEAESSARSDSDFEMVDVDLDKRECGYVRRVLFKTDTDVAIDVALIMLDKEAIAFSPELHFFARDKTDEKSQVQAVDKNFKRKDLKFKSGKSFEQEEKGVDLGYKVIKCGIMTDLSVGALAFGDTSPHAQVKVTTDTCRISRFILKGQLVVDKKVGKDFFQEGDSGSAVSLLLNMYSMH